MTGGLIDVGTAYKDKAMSGFVRESADQQRIKQANKDIEARDKQQAISTTTTAIGTALSVAMLIATL